MTIPAVVPGDMPMLRKWLFWRLFAAEAMALDMAAASAETWGRRAEEVVAERDAERRKAAAAEAAYLRAAKGRDDAEEENTALRERVADQDAKIRELLAMLAGRMAEPFPLPLETPPRVTPGGRLVPTGGSGTAPPKARRGDAT